MRVITEYNDKYKILAFTFVTFTFVRVGIYVWKMYLDQARLDLETKYVK